MNNDDFNVFSICTKLLSGGKGYIPTNRTLAEIVTTDGAILIGDLIFKYCYYYSNSRLTEDGFFYATIEDVQRSTLLNAYAQNKLLKKITAMDLVTIRYGSDYIRYFKINFDKIKHLLYGEEPFDSDGILNLKKLASQNLRSQDLKNSEEIINNINNKEINNVEVDTNPMDSIQLIKTFNSNNSILEIKQYILANKDIVNQKFIDISKPHLLIDLLSYIDNINPSLPYRTIKDLDIKELDLLSQTILAFRRNGLIGYRDIQEIFRLVNQLNYDTPEICFKLIEQLERQEELAKQNVRYY